MDSAAQLNDLPLWEPGLDVRHDGDHADDPREYFPSRQANGLALFVLNSTAKKSHNQIAPEKLGFFLYFFALARRTDAAHALWASAIQARDDAREAKGIPQRQGALNALATAEMAVIALHRCFEMVYGLVEKFSPGLQVPASVDKIRAPVMEIRHAFEHIDERAQGKINQQKTHPDALTIFNQPDFVNSSVLQYKTLTLNLETEVIAALLDCREFIMNAIENR